MFLLRFSWKNMWRNRNRTIITMAAIFFAVILSVSTSSLRDGIFDNLLKNVVGFYIGYIQVHKAGYQDEQILDNSFEFSEQTEQNILQQENVTQLTPRLESFALVSSDSITRGCLMVGIDPDKENQITSLKNKITAGSYLSGNDRGIIVSEGLAKRLKVKLHDTIVMIGQGYHGSTAAGKYPIKGLLHFGSPDLNDKVLFMTLESAQDLFSAYGQITSYVLAINNNDLAEKTASALQKKLGKAYEVLSWGEMIPDIKQHIATDTNNAKYIQAILYLLICFGIFGTLIMMIEERKFEMGMLVAIGMKKNRLILLQLMESVFTVLLGCLMGILASIPFVYYFNRHPIRIGGDTAETYERFGFEPIFPTSVSADHFIRQGLIVFIIGLLLSIYPVYKIIRLNPVKAMKQ